MTSKRQQASQPARTRRTPPTSADTRLDEALMESFPASDPIAVDMTEPTRERMRKTQADKRKRH
ncbi:hypothetical protein BJG93_06770 [Paraburkholderia sprentiae WSM5005]|uniref:Uncharacterized protein n=1 Tax=Paraburkholderia sprentiae WSM5005 TaxID=754502 RepID=A0A1I9YFN4_9BURK|nr:hypothetical protein [Paraburkholderia sprentiae]APA85117.1 hypothetical protein BJG93_06770 [Paraburkholderia sprentiae WSM5005]